MEKVIPEQSQVVLHVTVQSDDNVVQVKVTIPPCNCCYSKYWSYKLYTTQVVNASLLTESLHCCSWNKVIFVRCIC